jgi:hypothetical protein
MRYLSFIFLIAFFVSCTNPFAPGIKDRENMSDILGDQKTVDGVFANFKYSYLFKDTLVYGKLLANDFTFVYKNPESPDLNKSWGRSEDMISTNNLFKGTQNLNLIWDDVLIAVGDSTAQDISRGFTLSVTFSEQDKVYLYGKVIFRLEREKAEEVWKIKKWIDESYY